MPNIQTDDGAWYFSFELFADRAAIVNDKHKNFMEGEMCVSLFDAFDHFNDLI